METEEIIEQIVKTTEFATHIIEKLPTKEDTPFKKAVKCVAIADSVRLKYFKNNSLVKAIKKLKARRMNSEIIKDLFFQTELKDEFSIVKEKVNDCTTFIKAESGGAELNFVEYDWNGTPWVSNEFFVKNEETLDKVIEGMWEKYNGTIHVSYEFDPIERKKSLRLSTIEFNSDPLLGKSDDKLNTTVAQQQEFLKLGISRTYCLIGKPGTGKSTFAFRFAKKISNRILRFDAQELGCVLDSIGPFIVSLKPQVIIFDDFDRITSLGDHMSTILTMMTEIKSKFPEVVIMLTANNEKKLGSALLRPGRIDEIIDFEPPSKDDIRLLLKSYMDSIEAEYTDDELDRLINLSDGLAHSYIKELAIRKKVLHIDTICAGITRMKKIAGIKAEPEKKKKKKDKGKERDLTEMKADC